MLTVYTVLTVLETESPTEQQDGSRRFWGGLNTTAHHKHVSSPSEVLISNFPLFVSRPCLGLCNACECDVLLPWKRKAWKCMQKQPTARQTCCPMGVQALGFLYVCYPDVGAVTRLLTSFVLNKAKCLLSFILITVHCFKFQQYRITKITDTIKNTFKQCSTT